MRILKNGKTIATINLTLSSEYDDIAELKLLLRDKQNLELVDVDEKTKDAIRILAICCLYGLAK